MAERDYWAAYVNDITDVPHDPQVKHMKSLTSYHHPKYGKVQCVSPAISMSKTPLEIVSPPPMIGEHNEEILKSIGYSNSEIENLYTQKVISKQETEL